MFPRKANDSLSQKVMELMEFCPVYKLTKLLLATLTCARYGLIKLTSHYGPRRDISSLNPLASPSSYNVSLGITLMGLST